MRQRSMTVADPLPQAARFKLGLVSPSVFDSGRLAALPGAALFCLSHHNARPTIPSGLGPTGTDFHQPVAGNELMSLRKWVHSIPDPMLRRRYFDGSIEHVLGFDMYRIIVLRQSGNQHPELLSGGAAWCPCLFVFQFASGKDEGIHQNKPQVGIRAPAGIKNDTIISFEGFLLHATPNVIGADEDAQEVRPDLNRILLPALAKITHRVSAHTPFVDDQL